MVVAGLDFGGTATRIAIWGEGKCLSEHAFPTAAATDAKDDVPVRHVAELILALVPHGSTLSGVGIGASGPVDIAEGVIRNTYTLPGVSGIPIVAEFQRLLGCPVVIDNDAVVAAFAEHRLGAGEQARRMLMVTLGTGIGVALLLDGLPFRGPGGFHAEASHIPIISGNTRCYCGLLGCWEQNASRGALQARLQPFLPVDTPAEFCLAVAAAEAPRHPGIAATFADYGRLLGRGLNTLRSLYMPEVIVLGGSAAVCIDLFRSSMEREMERPLDLVTPAAVRTAALGEAGAIGAALMVSDRLRTRRMSRPKNCLHTRPA
jgi:glucokinase